MDTVRIYIKWAYTGPVDVAISWCWEEPGKSVDGFNTAQEAINHWQEHGTTTLPVYIEQD